MRNFPTPLGAHDATRPSQRGSDRPVVRNPSGSTRGPHGELLTWALPALLALSLGQAAPAQAQVQDKPDPVEGVIVTPPARTGLMPGLEACAPADYPCLDKALKAAALSAKPPEPGPPPGADQADTPTRVGTFSQAATAQRLGPNFGHAATPWRPASTATTSPFLAGRSTR